MKHNKNYFIQTFIFLSILLVFFNNNLQAQDSKKTEEFPRNISNEKPTIGRNILSEFVGSTIYLKGNYIEIGIAPNGCFKSAANAPAGYHPSAGSLIGLVADVPKDGWTTGSPAQSGDYFIPGSPFEGFMVDYNGSVYKNNIYGDFDISGANTSVVTEGSRKIATWEGEVVGKFTIKQKVEIDNNETYLRISVEIKNTGSADAIVYYSRVADPDQEYNLTGIYTTNNIIVSQAGSGGANKSIVRSFGTTYSLYYGLGSEDSRSKVAIASPWDLTPAAYYNGTGGAILTGTTTNDHAIALTLKESSLPVNTTTNFQIVGLTDIDNENIAFCKPSGTLAVEDETIVSGQSTNLIVSLNGTGPWNFLINGQPYSSTVSPFVLQVNPTDTTEYVLKNISNSCGIDYTPHIVTINVINCGTANAHISGSATIPFGTSTNLRVDLTGIAPWNFKVNEVSYTTNTTPFYISVSPVENKTYTVTNVTDYCGSGTSTGIATITVTVACDGYENNNSYAAATLIPTIPFMTNNMCFHISTDVDWFKVLINDKPYFIKSQTLNNAFTGNYKLTVSLIGGILSVETIPVTAGVLLDTELFLYDSNGTTQLAYDDDNGLATYSKIMFAVCPEILTHNTATLLAGIYSATNKIVSSTNISSGTSYYANKSIELLPGFQVGSNEVFRAEIKGCGQVEDPPLYDYVVLQPGPIDGQDGEVNSIQPSTVALNGVGKSFNPSTWTYGGTPNIKRAYIKFDLATIPSTAIIDSAYLYLYFSEYFIIHYPLYSGFEGHYGSNAFEIKRITSSWNQTTLTWDNKPTSIETNKISVAQSTSPTQDYPHINVVNLVKDMISNTNYGFELKMVSETPYNTICITSSDEDNANIRPKLIIYYHY